MPIFVEIKPPFHVHPPTIVPIPNPLHNNIQVAAQWIFVLNQSKEFKAMMEFFKAMVEINENL